MKKIVLFILIFNTVSLNAYYIHPYNKDKKEEKSCLLFECNGKLNMGTAYGPEVLFPLNFSYSVNFYSSENYPSLYVGFDTHLFIFMYFNTRIGIHVGVDLKYLFTEIDISKIFILGIPGYSTVTPKIGIRFYDFFYIKIGKSFFLEKIEEKTEYFLSDFTISNYGLEIGINTPFF